VLCHPLNCFFQIRFLYFVRLSALGDRIPVKVDGFSFRTRIPGETIANYAWISSVALFPSPLLKNWICMRRLFPHFPPFPLSFHSVPTPANPSPFLLDRRRLIILHLSVGSGSSWFFHPFPGLLAAAVIPLNSSFQCPIAAGAFNARHVFPS